MGAPYNSSQQGYSDVRVNSDMLVPDMETLSRHSIVHCILSQGSVSFTSAFSLKISYKFLSNIM
jgi:hypothetical protein